MTGGKQSAADRGAAARARGAMLRGVSWTTRAAHGQVVQAVGGPARARVIALLGAVLALNVADTSTVGAVAPQLEHSLHIGSAKIGLLSSVAVLAGALFVVPMGLVADRFRRIPLLSAGIVLWSIASLLSAFAGTYEQLLLSRLALGAVTATAGPAIASLIGDYFPAGERGRVYAYILSGEVAGAAAGFIISGTVASVISWRVAFVLLALPGFALARTFWRTVPEPVRGGQNHLEVGTLDLHEAVAAARDRTDIAAAEGAESDDAPGDNLAHATVRARGVAADPTLVLTEDTEQMRLTPALRYTLRIPTNLALIIGSALGAFFLSGLQTFAMLFLRGHYHASQVTAELALALLVAAALAGTLATGRLTDALLRHGLLSARMYLPAGCYLGAAALLVPGVLSSHLTPAIWFDAAGAALVSGANPALDAARLDIMPAGLWGRAESARTFLRSLAQAAAPLAFGGMADVVAGVVPQQAPVGTHTDVVSSGTARGLEITFLIMLSTLVAAGVVLLRARRTYPGDVATAAASEDAQPKPGDALHQHAPVAQKATSPHGCDGGSSARGLRCAHGQSARRVRGT